MKSLRRFKMQTLTLCGTKIMSTRTASGQFKGQFKGAMDESAGNVQNASTNILRRHSHEHAHNSRSVQGPVHGGKHTYSSVLSWMLQPSKLATPSSPTSTPPPCQPREQGQSPLGPWSVTCMGSIRRKTHGGLPRYTANSEHTIGAKTPI